jgi:hypothetical protein
MGARNRIGIRLLYRPARSHRLAESITWNRSLFKNTGSGINWKLGKRSLCISWKIYSFKTGINRWGEDSILYWEINSCGTGINMGKWQLYGKGEDFTQRDLKGVASVDSGNWGKWGQYEREFFLGWTVGLVVACHSPIILSQRIRN